jgi:hypothetical protein
MEFQITDYLNTKRNITDLIENKHTVIHFWTPNYVSNSHLKKRFSYLSRKFPKVNFILVKISDIETDYVHGIDIKKQYYLEPTSKANSFLTSKIPRTLLVNKNGDILNGYANVRARIFNDQIENLQKK